MTLPWIRLDTNLASHEKILGLVEEDHDPQRWRAAFSYVCSIGWSAASATDGSIPTAALRFIHGTPHTAELLVKHRLWDAVLSGWTIHNYSVRQELTATVEAKRYLRTQGAEKAACRRWHGPDCWTDKGCSRSNPL